MSSTSSIENSGPQRERYLALRDLSKHLQLSPRTLRGWVRDPQHPLPAYRVGGKLLFAWHEVERWLEQFRVEPIDPAVEAEAAAAIRWERVAWIG